MKKDNQTPRGRVAIFKTAGLGILLALLIAGTPFAYSYYKDSRPSETGLTNSSSPEANSNTSSPSTDTKPAATKGSTAPVKKYTPGSCTTTPIPYTTTYVDDPNTNSGETWSVGYTGVNGSKKTCTPSSDGIKTPDFTIPPVNVVIHKGTKPVVVTPPTSGYTYAQALSKAESNCRAIGANGSAWQQCVNAYMHQYGY